MSYIARNHIGGGRYVIHGTFPSQSGAERAIMESGSVVSSSDESVILSMRSGDAVFRVGDAVKIKEEFQRPGEAEKVFVVEKLNEYTLRAIIRDNRADGGTESIQLRMLVAA